MAKRTTGSRRRRERSRVGGVARCHPRNPVSRTESSDSERHGVGAGSERVRSLAAVSWRSQVVRFQFCSALRFFPGRTLVRPNRCSPEQVFAKVTLSEHPPRRRGVRRLPYARQHTARLLGVLGLATVTLPPAHLRSRLAGVPARFD